jgi:hypothetical protein
VEIRRFNCFFPQRQMLCYRKGMLRNLKDSRSLGFGAVSSGESVSHSPACCSRRAIDVISSPSVVPQGNVTRLVQILPVPIVLTIHG